MEVSRFSYEVGFFFERAQFVTLPRCPDVNANHPIEHNYGNSVRFLAKIRNGPSFCRQVPLFYAKCPSKIILQVGRSEVVEFISCTCVGVNISKRKSGTADEKAGVSCFPPAGGVIGTVVHRLHTTRILPELR